MSLSVIPIDLCAADLQRLRLRYYTSTPSVDEEGAYRQPMPKLSNVDEGDEESRLSDVGILIQLVVFPILRFSFITHSLQGALERR